MQAILNFEKGINATHDETARNALSVIRDSIRLFDDDEIDKWINVSSLVLSNTQRNPTGFGIAMEQELIEIYRSITYPMPTSYQFSEETRNFVVSKTKIYMESLAKSVAGDVLASDPAEDVLMRVVARWRTWTGILALCRGDMFVACLGKNDDAFILQFVSQLMKPVAAAITPKNKEVSADSMRIFVPTNYPISPHIIVFS